MIRAGRCPSRRTRVCETGLVSEPHQESVESRRPRKAAVLVAVACIVVALDVISKIFAVDRLEPTQSKRILGGLVYFSLVRNPGAAFGIAGSMTIVFAVVAVAVIVMIIRIAGRLRSLPWAIGLGLLLGGACGNLIDRVFRSPGLFRGHVVDFISVLGPDGEHFPVFNLADSAITIGAVALALTGLLGIGLDGRRIPAGPANPANPADPPDRDRP